MFLVDSCLGGLKYFLFLPHIDRHMFDKHMFDKHISRISYFYFAKWSNLTSIFFRWVGSTNHHLGIPRSREVGFDHIFESPTKKQAALDGIDELHCLFNGPTRWWSTWGCTLPENYSNMSPENGCHKKMKFPFWVRWMAYFQRRFCC